jgi:hypothetical protein
MTDVKEFYGLIALSPRPSTRAKKDAPVNIFLSPMSSASNSVDQHCNLTIASMPARPAKEKTAYHRPTNPARRPYWVHQSLQQTTPSNPRYPRQTLIKRRENTKQKGRRLTGCSICTVPSRSQQRYPLIQPQTLIHQTRESAWKQESCANRYLIVLTLYHSFGII